jgi:hypothetical protein
MKILLKLRLLFKKHHIEKIKLDKEEKIRQKWLLKSKDKEFFSFIVI